MNTSKLIEIFQSCKSKSLGCSMPAWKQGHAQIFYLSPNNAYRKKIKVITLLNCAMRVAGRELVYQTIPFRTIAFCTGIEY